MLGWIPAPEINNYKIWPYDGMSFRDVIARSPDCGLRAGWFFTENFWGVGEKKIGFLIAGFFD